MLLTKEQLIGENQMTHDQKVQLFESLLLSTNRKGVNEVIDYMRRTDFYTAPASAKYHSNYNGGLLDHSLFVYTLSEMLVDSLSKMDPDITMQCNRDSIIICSLLHDICKTCFYRETTKWRKDEHNDWQSYIGYEYDDTFPIGHGEKSVIMLQKIGLDLNPCEMLAIRYHMGHFGEQNVEFNMSMKTAMKMCSLITVIQQADFLATNLFEKEII